MNTNLLQNHIKNISENNTILSIDHKNYLKKLKESGFEPLIVYDIGAGALTWTNYVKTIWPDAIIIVFDAMDSFQFLYESYKLDYHIGVLSNNDPNKQMVKFYHNEYFFFGNSYYREIDCQCFTQYDLDDYIELPTQTILLLNFIGV